MTRRDVYISFDVETDGPTPGRHSLVSVGAVVLGWESKDGLVKADLNTPGFYAEMQPVSEEWIPESLAVSGLTREHLQRQQTPSQAMEKLQNWVEEVSGEDKPVFVAYPAGFDWRWVAHYLEHYSSGNPFGFGQVLDLKALVWALTGKQLTYSTKRALPNRFKSTYPHTHNALDDAREQAEMAQKLLSEIRSMSKQC